jgi:hypothetical protein
MLSGAVGGSRKKKLSLLMLIMDRELRGTASSFR